MDEFKETVLEGLGAEGLLYLAEERDQFNLAMDQDDITGIKRARLWGQLRQWYEQQPTQRRRLSISSTPVELELKFAGDPPETGQCFEVDGLDIAGLGSSENPKKRLYCRQGTSDLWSALENMKRGIRVSGCPGVGKSCTVWFWVCHQVLNHGKSVLWIHVDKDDSPKCIEMSSAGAYDLDYYDHLELERYIRVANADIVVIDGTNNLPSHGTLKSCVFVGNHKPGRISIEVSSMSIKWNYDSDRNNGIKHFHAFPWRVEEYQTALHDEEVLAAALPFLSDHNEEKLPIEEALGDDEIIFRKHFYAGGSARWMFGYTYQEVVSRIDDLFSYAPNTVDLLKNIVGERSKDSVNHLFVSYARGAQKKFFISEYVSRKALERGGAEAVRLAYGIANGLKNPSFTGWVVEMDFVHQIKASEEGMIDLVDDKWDVTDVVECGMDLESLQEIAGNLQHGCWLLPEKWNQGGYDLVGIVNNDGVLLLRFVQVTIGSNHSLNLKYFRELTVYMIEVMQVEIPSVEIVMMLPSSRDPESFEVLPRQVSCQGLLCEWKVGMNDEKWKKNREFEQITKVQFRTSRDYTSQ